MKGSLNIPAPLVGLFKGEMRLRILAHLSDNKSPTETTELVAEILGVPDKAKYAVMRNTIKVMRPKLRTRGYDIYGRGELRRNAYQLINTALE